MSDCPFRPKDKVLKRTDKDTSNIGEVMDLAPSHMKPGHIAVYFQRQVWIKPENLIHLEEWKATHTKKLDPRANLRTYWTIPEGEHV